MKKAMRESGFHLQKELNCSRLLLLNAHPGMSKRAPRNLWLQLKMYDGLLPRKQQLMNWRVLLILERKEGVVSKRWLNIMANPIGLLFSKSQVAFVIPDA